MQKQEFFDRIKSHLLDKEAIKVCTKRVNQKDFLEKYSVANIISTINPSDMYWDEKLVDKSTLNEKDLTNLSREFFSKMDRDCPSILNMTKTFEKNLKYLKFVRDGGGSYTSSDGRDKEICINLDCDPINVLDIIHENVHAMNPWFEKSLDLDYIKDPKVFEHGTEYSSQLAIKYVCDKDYPFAKSLLNYEKSRIYSTIMDGKLSFAQTLFALVATRKLDIDDFKNEFSKLNDDDHVLNPFLEKLDNEDYDFDDDNYGYINSRLAAWEVDRFCKYDRELSSKNLKILTLRSYDSTNEEVSNLLNLPNPVAIAKNFVENEKMQIKKIDLKLNS